MKVLGAGGYGIVYALPNGDALKAIYSRDACNKASIEFGKQRRIYTCFEQLRHCRDRSEIVSLVNRYVHIAKPITFSDENVELENTRYECSLTMQRLNGLPLAFYETFDGRDTIKQRFAPDYYASLSTQGDQLMGHLAFNSQIGGIQGVKYSRGLISRTNPARGYFILKESGFLDFLRKEHAFPLSDSQLEQIMAFVYGWIYYACDLIPLDIEMALGYNVEQARFELNVMDFGWVFDKRLVSENAIAPFTTPFFKIFDDAARLGQSVEEREAAILAETLYFLTLDLYLAVEEEPHLTWFKQAALIRPCASCYKLTSLVFIQSTRCLDKALFICSEQCLIDTQNKSH